MAVALDAKCAAVTEISAVNGTTGKTSTNLTVTASATALLVSLCFDGSATLTAPAVHWDSTGTNVALTQIGTTLTVSGVGQIMLFGLVSPVSGAKTLKATWTGTGTGYMASMSVKGSLTSSVAAAFTGYLTGTPTGTTGSFGLTGGASGNMAFAVNGNDNVTYTTFLTTTGGTALYTDANENYSGAAFVVETGTTTTFTWAQGSSNQNVVAGVNIIQASSGTNANATGVAGTGAAGTVIASVGANDTGVTGTGAAGTIIAQDSSTITGVAGTSGVGAPLSQIGSTDIGVAGSGGVGSLAGSLGGTMGGVGGTGQVGTGTASVAANISGAAGTGAVGVLGTPGTVNGTVVGVGGTGQSQGLSDEIDVSISGVAGHGHHGILTTSGGITPTAPVIAGGPGDDDADEARRKWLEWSRKRRQKQKQLLTKPERPIPAKVEVTAETPPQSLLERNLAAQRMQTMQRMLDEAEAARLQEEDDEEAIALLLDA